MCIITMYVQTDDNFRKLGNIIIPNVFRFIDYKYATDYYYVKCNFNFICLVLAVGSVVYFCVTKYEIK